MAAQYACNVEPNAAGVFDAFAPCRPLDTRDAASWRVNALANLTFTLATDDDNPSLRGTCVTQPSAIGEAAKLQQTLSQELPGWAALRDACSVRDADGTLLVGCICTDCYLPGAVHFASWHTESPVKPGCSQECVAQVLATSAHWEPLKSVLPWQCADADLALADCPRALRTFEGDGSCEICPTSCSEEEENTYIESSDSEGTTIRFDSMLSDAAVWAINTGVSACHGSCFESRVLAQYGGCSLEHEDAKQTCWLDAPSKHHASATRG